MHARLSKRPDNYGTSDPTRYETHFPVYTLAENADDLLAESNWHAMVSALVDVYEPTDDVRRPLVLLSDYPDVYVAQERHWAVGPISVLYVRAFDHAPHWSPAWMAACDLLTRLEDYPALDESDWSERELVAWDENVRDALGDAMHEGDTDDDLAVIGPIVAEEYAAHTWRADDVSWSDVASLYDTIRHDVYDARAVAYVIAEREAVDATYYALFA